ncbi:hypothetical protein VTN31DRAFT_6540 [Thermomyces dupontii]|uniref:uncharacterized protein n=1 Tax=Talaromyces thermophilus TaxID=28565 RepID=UPI003743A048
MSDTICWSQIPNGNFINPTQIERLRDSKYRRELKMFSQGDVAAALNAVKDADLKFRWLYVHAKLGSERSNVCVELEITGSKEPSITVGNGKLTFLVILKGRENESKEELQNDESSVTRSTEVSICNTPIGAWPSPRRLGTYLPIAFFIARQEMYDEYVIKATLEIRGRKWQLPDFELRCDGENVPRPLKGILMQPADHPDRQ